MARRELIFVVIALVAIGLTGALQCLECDWGADPNHAGGGGATRCKKESDQGELADCDGYCLHQTTRVYGTSGPVYRSCSSDLPPEIELPLNGTKCTEQLSGVSGDIKITKCFCDEDGCNGKGSAGVNRLAGMSLSAVAMVWLVRAVVPL